MRIIHHTPRPGTQTFLGVTFRDGVATLDALHPYTREALAFHGFTIEDTPEVKPAAETESGLVDLTALDKKQLLDMVPDGVAVSARASRDKLIEILSEHYTPEPIRGSVDNDDATFTHPGSPEFTEHIPGQADNVFGEPEAGGEAYIPGGD